MPEQGRVRKRLVIEEVQNAIEMGKNVSPKFTPWIDISRFQDNIHEKEGIKIHVGIHPKDYERALEHILPVIMEYRDRHGIGAKFAVKEWAEEMVNHETQRGKTITIYVPEDVKHVAPEIVEKIERIIEEKNIKTTPAAPNDVIVGRTGAVGVSYAHFGGGKIEVPEEYAHIYGKKHVEDKERRKNPHLAVPLWKEKDFVELFGKVPENIALFKALVAHGLAPEQAFRALKTYNLRKEAVKRWEKDAEQLKNTEVLDLLPGEVGILPAKLGYMLIHGRNAPEGRTGGTVIAGRLIHGGHDSPMRAPAYVLKIGGYVKIEKDGQAKLRIDPEELHEYTNHLHDEPHVIVEPDPKNGIIRVHNVGRWGVNIIRME